MEIETIYILIFILVTLQTIVGVGVLVLGTPFLLLVEYNIVEAMSFLLPISITTSLLNYIYLKSNKEKFNISLDRQIKKNFIVIFLPGILIGLFLTKQLINHINFELLVSLVIFISLLTKWKFEKKINNFSFFYKKFILIAISIIHGLTNSGGTLLTIFFSAFNKNQINQSRYSITFYYLILASVQYFIFLIIFKNEISIFYTYEILFLIIFSIFTGTLIVKYISQIFFKKIIELLALFSATILLMNNFNLIN